MAERVKTMPQEVEGVAFRLPLETELIERVSWTIRLRWLVAAGLLTVTWLSDLVLEVTLPRWELSGIAAAILAYNLIFFWQLGRLRSRTSGKHLVFSRFAGVQILLDWLALTLVVHFTGGLESPAIFFFVFNAIIAAILLRPRVAFLLASSGILLVAGLALLECCGVLESHAIPQLADPRRVPFTSLAVGLFSFVSAIAVSMVLATSITRRLVRRTRELAALQQSLQAAYQKMRTLYDTARAVNSTLDLPKVLSTITRQAAEVMQAKASSIRLLDEEQHTLEVSAAYGLSDAYLAKGKVDPDKGEMDRLNLRGQPVSVLDVTTDPRFQYPEEAHREGIRSVLSVPMLLQDHAIGVLRVYSAGKREFSQDEVDFLMTLAGQGAAAIQNARAFHQLQELEEAKSRFVFKVTHELKSPVAAVQSLFAVLQGGYAGDLSAQQQEMINRVASRMAGLQALLKDLLALGALKGRLPQHRLESLDLGATARRVIEGIQPAVQAKALRLTVDLPAAPVPYLATQDDLERLFGNLLENAVKYTPTGGTLRLEVRDQAERVRILVSDTGIGIPDQDRPHLFEEFFRARNAKESGAEGTGLGLSLVKRIVDFYRGEIQVDSVSGQGTTFTVLLPRDPAAGTGV